MKIIDCSWRSRHCCLSTLMHFSRQLSDINFSLYWVLSCCLWSEFHIWWLLVLSSIVHRIKTINKVSLFVLSWVLLLICHLLLRKGLFTCCGETSLLVPESKMFFHILEVLIRLGSFISLHRSCLEHSFVHWRTLVLWVSHYDTWASYIVSMNLACILLLLSCDWRSDPFFRSKLNVEVIVSSLAFAFA